MENSKDIGVKSDVDFNFALSLDRPWIVIVWDDPINLMSYVVRVFVKVLKVNKERAHYLMLEVHNKEIGRAHV